MIHDDLPRDDPPEMPPPTHQMPQDERGGPDPADDPAQPPDAPQSSPATPPCAVEAPLQAERTVCGAHRQGEQPCQNPPDGCPLHCGAATRNTRTGSPYCPATPVRGRRRCRMHGGAVPRGTGLPQFQGRGYSKVLPGPIARDVLRAREDPNLGSLREELALIQALLLRSVRRIKTGEHGSLWDDLRHAHDRFKDAVAKNDQVAVLAAMRSMEDVVTRGQDAEIAIAEVLDLIDRKADVAAKEWRRLVDLRQVITAERALNLVTAVMLIVKRNVPDVQTLRTIDQELAGLLTADPKV